MITNSVISLDLGGKNTGFFSFTSQDISKIDNFQSGTIIYDESFGLSQVERRGKRHTKRNNLRNKLVKRLFLLILQKHYALNIDFLHDEILGLFNKRGYIYASFELNDEKKEKLESDELREILEEQFGKITQDSIERFLTDIASNENDFKKFFANFKTFKEVKSKEKLSNSIKSGLKTIEDILNEHDKQQNQGNLPRDKYFEELKEEITQNSEIQNFFKSHNLKIQDMQNLIGNLSNYQLKELRRYFNDKEMAKGDIWFSDKLHKITWRFIQSWHSKNIEDNKRQKENLSNLNSKNIIEFLTTTNPSETIPPYDDMNNRGAVKCQSLRLNENYLDAHLPNWRNITQRLASENQKESLEDATIKGSNNDSTLLHRILDTSKEIDSYKLRGNKIDGYIDILGKEDSLSLQKFTKNYYELIRSKVRTGIWTKDDDMLKKCEHNPPYKNNQIHNLIAGILGVKIESDKFILFEKELWNIKFGNKKLSNYCKNIEELRKSHGNLFKTYIEELFKDGKNVFTKEEESNKKLLDLKVLNEWVKKIGDFFCIEEKYRERFNNHFSMAQLYTIIETKRNGFNSTCKWCTAENQWRSKTSVEINQETGEIFKNANAQRLPADTQRPFSGKIERYIDKLGYEIAKIKVKELQNSEDKKINLKIILEQNAFEYEETIRSAKIKNANAKAKKTLEESTNRYTKSLYDKATRIKSFSNGTCPYCGESLGEDGEIDHILSRSHALKFYDTVFNSEGNLLYVHQKCNQAKKENIYKLSDIKAPITQEEIEKIINPLSKNSYKTFTALTPEQQKAFKYALFLDNSNEAYKKVVDWLRTDQSSRVNGTQKYLAKNIQEKLKAMLPHKEFDFEFILADANDVHNLREKYQLPQKPKDSKQEAYSHTIDAIISLVSVWNKVLPKTPELSKEDILRFSNIENWSAINNEFLTKGKSTNQKIEEMINTQDFSQRNMGQIFSKPIFGENALGERFKPIIIKNDKLYIGYPIKTKNGYNLDKCKVVDAKNDKVIIELIIKSKLALRNDKAEIIIYEINKLLFNELSNQYFNLSYENLIDNEKEQVAMIEYIIKYNKYYTKKVDVKFAPSYKKEIEEMKYPFYNEWKLFDEAWQYFRINENKKDFRNRYIIDKKQKNPYYQVDLKKGEYKFDADTLFLWDDFCKWYFLDRFKKDENTKTIRKKARKTFSLIAEGVAQGTVFRLKRKTPNGFVYQVLPIDNKQIAGDYSNILLYGNKKSISLVSREPKKELTKKLEIKESKDIRDIKFNPSKFFKEGFDYSNIEVVLNKTSATIRNFPIDYFKDKFVQNSGNFGKELKTLSFVKNNQDFGVIKSNLDVILKMTTRGDQNISKITVRDGFIDFTLPYKNTSKLLDD